MKSIQPGAAGLFIKWLFILVCCWAYLQISGCIKSCKISDKTETVALDRDHTLLFLTKEQAADTVCVDRSDHYFEKVGVLDMSLQLRRAYPTGTARQAILSDYYNGLKKDVADFSDADQKLLKEVFQKAFADCDSLGSNIFSKEVNLIKSTGALFGDGVFYTREHSMIIPANELKTADKAALLKTMLHELGHIYSRAHAGKKPALYAALGFRKLENTNMLINDSLYQRLLTNPDGVDYSWATALTTADGKNVLAVPLIYSNEYEFTPKKSAYIDYLSWNYFEAQNTAQGVDILTGRRQQTTLQTKDLPALFKEKLNTDYVIHPDEIFADNFALLAGARGNIDSVPNISVSGRTLLQQLKKLIKN